MDVASSFQLFSAAPLSTGVMHKDNLNISLSAKWIALTFLCFVVASVGWVVIGHYLSHWEWYVCPEGWWRSSPGQCAFPPVSISSMAISYTLVSILLLATVSIFAPARKLKLCLLLLSVLWLLPVFTLLFIKFSWVALASLSGIAFVTICFTLGALAMHNPSFKRDA